jgi:tetratricopeptide (TPR) repeat protein
MVVDGLKEGSLRLEELGQMEVGLGGLYSSYNSAFEHRFGAQYQETVQPLLRLVMAAPGPLPLALAAEVLGCGKEEARKMRLQLGAYLVEGSAGLSLFHKTLGEWLGSEASGVFFTDSESAQRKLGEFLWGCFERREKDDNDDTKILKWEEFVSEWLMKLLPIMPQWEDWDALSDFGKFQHERIRHEAAEPLFRRALEGKEKELGPHHPDTLTNVDNLGQLLRDEGDDVGAEALFRRVLNGREKALGVQHPETLETLRRLGNSLRRGDEEEKEALFRRALDGFEKTLGAQHPRTLRSGRDLGVSLRAQGDFEGAEALLRRALEGFEKTLGAHHRETLMTVGDLGHLLRKKGDYEGAEVLYRRAHDGFVKALGANHVNTLTSLNNLGSLLAFSIVRRFSLSDEVSKGHYEGVEAILRHVLNGGEKALGAEHPATLGSLRELNDLGNLLSDKGDYGRAEALYRRALEGFEKTLGAKHPDTLGTLVKLNNLGVSLKYKGDYEGAEALYRLALEGYEKALGAENPTTLMLVHNLGDLFVSKNRADAKKFILDYIHAYPSTEKFLNYTLAFFSALEGDFDAAKSLIFSHLEAFPQSKGRSLADSDLAPIRDFIETL